MSETLSCAHLSEQQSPGKSDEDQALGDDECKAKAVLAADTCASRPAFGEDVMPADACASKPDLGKFDEVPAELPRGKPGKRKSVEGGASSLTGKERAAAKRKGGSKGRDAGNAAVAGGKPCKRKSVKGGGESLTEEEKAAAKRIYSRSYKDEGGGIKGRDAGNAAVAEAIKTGQLLEQGFCRSTCTS